MKIINEIQLKNKRTKQTKHIFTTDGWGQLLIIYNEYEPTKDEKIATHRQLIEESSNIMDYHDRLFQKQFNDKIKRVLQ